jgi:hypothetical protein
MCGVLSVGKIMARLVLLTLFFYYFEFGAVSNCRKKINNQLTEMRGVVPREEEE